MAGAGGVSEMRLRFYARPLHKGLERGMSVA